MSELHTTDRSQLVVHMPKLRALAQHLVQGPDAEDFVQDTFATALANPAGPRRPGPWLRQVLRNVVRGHARQHTRREALEPLIPVASEARRPDEVSERAEIAARVHEVLDELAEPYRTVLRHRFFGEQSTLEIARRVGRPHGTVRWQLHEGLRRMRQVLDQRFGERTRWYGAVMVLSGGQTGLVAPATQTQTMTTTTSTTTTSASTTTSALFAKAVLPTTAVLGLAGLVYAAVGNAPPEPPTVAAVVPAPEQERVSDAALPLEPVRPSAIVATPIAATPAVLPAANGQLQPHPDRPRQVADVAAGEPELSVSDALRCAEDAIEAHNADDDETNGPEHLVDAARCFEMAGSAAKALAVNRKIVSYYPQSIYVDEAQLAVGRMFTAMVNMDAGNETPLGRECLAALAQAGDHPSGPDLVDAAECATEGMLVATALHFHEQAARQPDTIDAAENDEQIALLSKTLAGLETRAEAHAKAMAEAAAVAD